MITRNGNRLEVAGNLTMATASALYGSGLQAQGETSLVVDLARVEAVDSSAVSLLLSWLREAQRSNVTLCFAHVPENLLSLAKLYGIADALPICRAE